MYEGIISQSTVVCALAPKIDRSQKLRGSGPGEVCYHCTPIRWYYGAGGADKAQSKAENTYEVSPGEIRSAVVKTPQLNREDSKV